MNGERGEWDKGKGRGWEEGKAHKKKGDTMKSPISQEAGWTPGTEQARCETVWNMLCVGPEGGEGGGGVSEAAQVKGPTVHHHLSHQQDRGAGGTHHGRGG